MTLRPMLPLWASLFTFSFWALISQYLSLFFPMVSFPAWLWVLLLLSSFESAYFAAYFLNARTPFFVRILELALFTLPLYLSYREFTLELLWPFLLIFGSWIVARGYGTKIVVMEKVADTLGDQGASTVNWEYESLTSKGYHGSLPMEYFWRRFFSFGMILTVATIIALPDSLGLNLAILGCLFVASGLMLQGTVYLFRLEILWNFARAEVDFRLRSIWLRNLAAFVLVMVLLVSVAPVNYSPITAERVGQALLGLWSGEEEFMITPTPSQENAALAPEPLDFSLEEGEPGIMGLVITILIFFLLALVGLLFLFVLGLLLFTLVKGELERLRGLPNLIVQVYLSLSRILKSLLQRLGLERLSHWLPEQTLPMLRPLANRWGKPSKRRHGRLDLRGVRAMFRALVKEGGKKGILYKEAQTPAEYGELLHQYLSSDQHELDEFFEGYHKVRYGMKTLNKEEEELLLKAGAQLLKEMQGLEKGD